MIKIPEAGGGFIIVIEAKQALDRLLVCFAIPCVDVADGCRGQRDTLLCRNRENVIARRHVTFLDHGCNFISPQHPYTTNPFLEPLFLLVFVRI